MKKLLILLLSILMLSSVFAVTFIYEQPKVISDKIITNFASTKIFDINSSYSDFNYSAYKIGTISNDYKFRFSNVNNKVFIIIDNLNENTNITITYVTNRFDINTIGSQSITQNFTMNEKGEYYFEFVPSYNNEWFDIGININNFPNEFYQIKIKNEINKGVAPFLQNIIIGLDEYISLNTDIWKITYYTYVLIIIIGTLIFIILLGIKLIELAKSIEKEKERALQLKEGY